MSLTSDDDVRVLFGPSRLENDEAYDEKQWSMGHLKSQFETLELCNLFRRYTNKVRFGYFSLFLILIFCLFFTHAVLLLIENINKKDKLNAVMPDLVIYSSVSAFALVGLYLLEIAIKNRKNWTYFAGVAFAIVVVANFTPPLYHDFRKTSVAYNYTPAYTFLIIIGCYMFLGLENDLLTLVAGVTISAGHFLILIFISYRNSDKVVARMFSDAIYIVCFNGLGIYFRYLNEIVQRKSFLDRRDCIANTFQLRQEKEQEEQLMASIIPAPLINKVKQNYLRSQENYKRRIGSTNDTSTSQDLLEEHDGITILFADIVNYTKMTNELSINNLLQVLNELFGRFDDASDRLKVIRIKFLGDCYYCVSGLPPDPPENPAEACVDLGLTMIHIVADVRDKYGLNIDMRIGIHTGRIVSGIIGKVKYQFDIWSKDVDIANKMESEGKAGQIHITSTTKALLSKKYHIVPNDDNEYKQQTYLVSSTLVQDDELLERDQFPIHRSSIYHKNSSMPNLLRVPEELTIIESNNLESARRNTLYQRRVSQRFKVTEERRMTSSDVKRRTAFMNTNTKRSRERESKVDLEMELAIDDMSFSKRDQYATKGNEISALMIFTNRKTELEYIKLKDPMFKYYVLSQVVLIFCVYLIQNLTLESRAWLRYEFITSQLILLGVLLPSTWTYHLHLQFNTNFRDIPPSTCIFKWFYKLSKFITLNFWARLLIYTVVWVLFLSCVFVEIWSCHDQGLKDPQSIDNGHCMVPWHMTASCGLALIMTFLFLKILIWLKLLYALLTSIAYCYCVLYYVTPIYQGSETFNPHLSPLVAHVLSIVFLMFTLHLVDRQTDYMNRLDFLWTTKLLNEKKKADEQQRVNTNMLINILPKHVAKIYLDVNNDSMKDLYYENHNHAAVMFASMMFDEVCTDSEMSFLQIMNEYITIIDTLVSQKEFSKVEKIKIAKWTYMAACGLTVPGESYSPMESHPTSNTLELLLNFASTMMKEFKANDNKIAKIRLRIGICHGEIVGGVVGSKKPLYDIWGNAVNMASRMDSTGSAGNIQVLETTARQIEKLGYECVPRGIVFVKGVGDMSTFYVKMDTNYNLMKKIDLDSASLSFN